MKFRWDKKYLYWGITAFLVIISSILFYYVLFHGQNLKKGFSNIINISMPIIYGLILAYLLNPVLNFVENKEFKNKYTNTNNINSTNIIYDNKKEYSN